MSAFGGKAEVFQGAAKSPLIAKSGHCTLGVQFGSPSENGIIQALKHFLSGLVNFSVFCKRLYGHILTAISD